MIPERYSIGNPFSAIRNPSKIASEFTRITTKIDNRYFQYVSGVGDGIDVIEEDWDNLIILDACRADLFEEVVDLDKLDKYKIVESKASKTKEWVKKNFENRELGDTVYVNANPMVSTSISGVFHEFIEVWEDESAYDNKTRTIRPESVINYAYEAAEQYPNKRLIIHFVQPHFPFIPHPDLIFRPQWDSDSNEGPAHVWEAVEQGMVSQQEVWEAYRDNLDYVIEDIIQLSHDLPGKSIISSDHGNMNGERTPLSGSRYGHPGGVRSPQLVNVPWAEICGENRKTVTEEKVKSNQSQDSDKIEQPLSALGYVE